MSRDLHATNRAFAEASAARVALLAEFEFSGGTVRAWSGVGDLTVTIASVERTFQGTGDFAQVAAIDETIETAPRALDFTLSGIPSNLVSTIYNEVYRGRRVRLWLAFMDADFEAPLAEPYQIWAGRMDTCEISRDSQKAEIRLRAESGLVDLRRPRISRYSHEEQTRRFAADTGLRFVSGLSERPIYWRVPAPAGTPGYGSK